MVLEANYRRLSKNQIEMWLPAGKSLDPVGAAGYNVNLLKTRDKFERLSEATMTLSREAATEVPHLQFSKTCIKGNAAGVRLSQQTKIQSESGKTVQRTIKNHL
jgi:hypothetical protein